MIDRRDFTFAVGTTLLTWSFATNAQPAARRYRLGILRPTAPLPSDLSSGTSLALRELGYVEGKNLVLEQRSADGNVERLPELARELAALNPDAIVAVGSAAIRAAKDASATIPIVLFGNFDPVALGIVASLARPEGNITGVLIAPEGTLAGKKLELLKETVPRATRIALLSHGDPGVQLQVREAQKAASTLGLELVVVNVVGGDYRSAFAAIAAGKPDALFVEANTFFVRDSKQIIDLAAKHRLPAIYEWSSQVIAGGLMAYGGSQSEVYHRVAAYVDRIFKGARPGDLPIEQPTRLYLTLNLKTAKALGLTIPQSLLLRADEVIQ